MPFSRNVFWQDISAVVSVSLKSTCRFDFCILKLASRTAFNLDQRLLKIEKLAVSADDQITRDKVPFAFYYTKKLDIIIVAYINRTNFDYNYCF